MPRGRCFEADASKTGVLPETRKCPRPLRHTPCRKGGYCWMQYPGESVSLWVTDLFGSRKNVLLSTYRLIRLRSEILFELLKIFRRERSRSAPNAVTRQRAKCEFLEVPIILAQKHEVRKTILTTKGTKDYNCLLNVGDDRMANSDSAYLLFVKCFSCDNQKITLVLCA